jgi:hypothetical protein
MRIRRHPESNYAAFYFNHKTIRFYIDENKPVTSIEYPEFYDVKITNKCFGNCPSCYQDSLPTENHAENSLEKLDAFFGILGMNERPFQVAIGGGEPTLHPEFISILEKFASLEITPNYTTNAMNITDEIIKISAKLCGGVAVSAHSHLKDKWAPNIKRLYDGGVPLAMHHIISNEKSVDVFLNEMEEWGNMIKYHVLLRVMPVGRSKDVFTCRRYMFDKIKEMPPDKMQKISFGALFYEELLEESIPVSIYEPEAFSRYLDLINMKCYASSFDLTEKPVPHWQQ